MTEDLIPKPGKDLYGFTKAKPEDNTKEKLLDGLVALSKVILRGIIWIGLGLWNLMANLLNGLLRWAENIQKSNDEKIRKL